MTLKKYMKSLTKLELVRFAKRADTSIAYLQQLASGHRKAGTKSLVNITKASNGMISITDLRPEFKKKRRT